MVDELRPCQCPFCGRAPDETSRPSTKSADEIDGEIFFLSCKCGGFSARAHQYGHSRAEAIAAWNTRALAAVPGYVVVPRVPTWEMVEAGANVDMGSLFDDTHVGPCAALAAYRAMLAASPFVEGGEIDQGAGACLTAPGSRVCDPEPLAASQPVGADPSRGEG